MSSYRARVYRLIFAGAAAYNLAFGAWAGFWPQSFFTLFDLTPPVYPSIWACLGMVVGVYGLGYAYAARHLDRAAPFIAIGLLGKVLGPAGWILTVAAGEWPARTITLILFNDVIWWVPFTLFLADGTRAAASLRRRAPLICPALNLLAMVAMAMWLRFGTEIVPLTVDRISYITAHPVLWRAGWGMWIAAAISLVAFYAWWGSHLAARPRETTSGPLRCRGSRNRGPLGVSRYFFSAYGRLGPSSWAVGAVAVATVGLLCDVSGESILIGWLPRDYDRLAPLATQLTGTWANGLYTLAGILLTIATPLRGSLRALTWATWLAGAAVTASTLARSPMAIAISTTVLFVLFCPCVVLIGRSYRSS